MFFPRACRTLLTTLKKPYQILSEAVPTTCADVVSSARKRNLRGFPSPSTLPVIIILAPANLPIETVVGSSIRV